MIYRQKKRLLLEFFQQCEQKIWAHPRITQRTVAINETDDATTLDSYYARVTEAYHTWLSQSVQENQAVYQQTCTVHDTLAVQDQQEAEDILSALV